MSSTNFARNGLSDWLVQRLSAVVLLAFVLGVAGFYAYSQPHMDYETWRGYFSSWGMKIFTFVALFSLLGHIWVGLWTVITDYIKPLSLRMLCYALLVLFVVVLLVWVGMVVFSL